MDPARPSGEPIVAARNAWYLAVEAHDMLVGSGEPMGPGLAGDEVERVESRFGVRFSPVHRAFLSLGLPRGPQWPNWRSGSVRDLRARVEAPLDGVVADVLEHDFWPARWGPRPIGLVEREAMARDRLAGVPTLVPLYARCYLPAAHGPASYPVLDVDRTFVTVAGRDLLHYVMRVFLAHDQTGPDARPQRVPFWSELVELFDPERVRPGIMEP